MAGSSVVAAGVLRNISNWAMALREYACGSVLGSDGGAFSPVCTFIDVSGDSRSVLSPPSRAALTSSLITDHTQKRPLATRALRFCASSRILSLWYVQPSQNTAMGRREADALPGQMTKSGLQATRTPSVSANSTCGSIQYRRLATSSR